MSGPFGDEPRITSLEDILGLQLEMPETRTSVAVSATPVPPFLSLKDAAVFLGISLSTLNRLLARGELVAFRIDARRKIPADLLTTYISREVRPSGYSTGYNQRMVNQISVSKT
jgi:excisionase family DNA binding protein